MNIIDNRKIYNTYAKDLDYGDYFYFDNQLCLITDEPIQYGSRDEYCLNYVNLSDGITDYIRNDQEVELVDVDIVVKCTKRKEN